ncbi:hypothetical protein ACP70R_011389 [Stipagrostis hirtigluma subsp. patula]
MGKNQAYKAMQRARLGSSSSGAPGAADAPEDGMWHAARLASLNKTHTITWEEFKKKQKEEELKRGEMEADKDKMMREYRAQLDADRAKKLSLGRNHSSSKSKSSSSRKDRKDKDAKKRSKKRRKNTEVHQIQVPAHHQNHQAAMMRAAAQGSPDRALDRREQRRKRSTDQGPSTPTVIMRRKEVQFDSLNSLGSKELDTVSKMASTN